MKATSRRPRLFLLTTSFPYGKGEPFIADELIYLSQSFSCIHILTSGIQCNKLQPIPKSITVDTLCSVAPWTARLTGPWIVEAISAMLIHPTCVKVALKSWWQSQGYAQSILYYINKYSKDDDPAPIIYAYWMTELAMAAVHVGSQIDARICSRAHGWDLYEERHPYNYLPFRRYLSARLKTSFPISENGQKRLSGMGFSNVQVARLGVQPMLESPPTEIGNRTILVSISNLIPIKRIDILIESFTVLSRGDIKWIHIGNGPEEENIRSLAKSLRIDYQFLNHMDNKSYREYLHSIADEAILVNASLFEGIPVSMMDAMSMGIPCIGPNVGGVSEIIENGINGYLLDPNSIVSSIQQIIEQYTGLSFEERLELKRRAFETWRTRFNAESNYRYFASQLERIT